MGNSAGTPQTLEAEVAGSDVTSQAQLAPPEAYGSVPTEVVVDPFQQHESAPALVAAQEPATTPIEEHCMEEEEEEFVVPVATAVTAATTSTPNTEHTTTTFTAVITDFPATLTPLAGPEPDVMMDSAPSLPTATAYPNSAAHSPLPQHTPTELNDATMDVALLASQPESAAAENGEDDSSSSSDSDIAELSAAIAAGEGYEDDGDDEFGGSSGRAGRNRSTAKAEPVVVTAGDISIDPATEIKHVGKMLSVVDGMAVIQGVTVDLERGGTALEVDSVICTSEKQALGIVSETFGPCANPFYTLIPANGVDLNTIEKGIEVFCALNHSTFVVAANLKSKGSDASNKNDEEPDAYELEFSDDDEEAAHRLKLKRERRTLNTPLPDGVSEDMLHTAELLDAESAMQFAQGTHQHHHNQRGSRGGRGGDGGGRGRRGRERRGGERRGGRGGGGRGSFHMQQHSQQQQQQHRQQQSYDDVEYSAALAQPEAFPYPQQQQQQHAQHYPYPHHAQHPLPQHTPQLPPGAVDPYHQYYLQQQQQHQQQQQQHMYTQQVAYPSFFQQQPQQQQTKARL
eukprot:TRINITY_DN5982_c1_g3_i1.p1 TRINITY_DN5982_c1_g3~~TRINITY_DN5982_c1_g3_i1.p1  ORF type:complete len:570 (-),score=193.84 TRINITY_DN5982_c1_g3_i1:40-1749(-)